MDGLRARLRAAGRGAIPRLVYCAISGYGYDAPDRPAMDNIVQAASGVMAKTGFPDGPPLRAGITIADHASATFAALGILAALRQRDATGRGPARRRRDARRAHRVGVGRAGRPLRRDRHAAAHRERRRARRADQHLPLRRRLDLGDLHERPAVAAAVRPHGARRRARRAGRRSASAPARRPRSTRRWKRGRRRGRCARSRPRSSRSASRPGGCATRSRPPTTSSCARAGCSPSCAIRARRPTGRAASSARRCRSRSTGRVELPPAELLGTSTDAVLRELAGCDDDELARLRADGVIA